VSDPVRIALVGAGIMGTNHARVLQTLRDVELVVVVDPDEERAGQVAAASGARAVRSLDEVLADVDAVIVAAPTAHHLDTALAVIGAGLPVLVEKPLAGNVADAERIASAAVSAGVVLAVGHIERFNPAVAEVPKLLDHPVHIEATRINPYSGRIGDGVIHDLMVHDLDIIASLVGDTQPVSVQATSRTIRGEREDLATCLLTFESGLTAALTASRLGQSKIRTLEITQADSYVTVDLIRQDVTINRTAYHEYVADEGVRYRQSSMVEIPFLEQRGEPLMLELRHFVDCVRGDAVPRVSGADGVRALALADRVAEAARQM
jgi:predicted dehydrogenase